MLINHGDRVSAAEGAAIVQQLRELAERSERNRQRLFHFVYWTAAESLDDNLSNAAEMDSDADQ